MKPQKDIQEFVRDMDKEKLERKKFVKEVTVSQDDVNQTLWEQEVIEQMELKEFADNAMFDVLERTYFQDH